MANTYSIERPNIVSGQQYVQWTEYHQAAAAMLPPSSVHLWQYLLRKQPAGTLLEIDLKEEAITISNGRSKPYCVRSLKNALVKYLAPQNLVEIVKDYTGGIFKVIAHHAGPVKEVVKQLGKFLPYREEYFQNVKTFSKTEASNPDSAVPLTEGSNLTIAAAESEKSLEPDPDLVEQEVNTLEQAQLTGEPTSPGQPTVTHSVDDNSQDFSTNDLTHHEDAFSVPSNEKDSLTNDLTHHEDASPVPCDQKEKDSLTNDLTSRVDTSRVPSDEREEENIKLCEVRDVVGKLTSDLKKLVVNFTLSDLRKAIALYQQRQQKQQIHNPYKWLKKCLEQKWWQDKPANTNAQADARKNIPEPVAASSRLTEEQKAWYERAIAQGICLKAAIAELPVKMGLVCARVAIPNRRPYDPLFDVLPIEELMVQYPL